MPKTVCVVMRETSDQYGKSEPYAVCATPEIATIFMISECNGSNRLSKQNIPFIEDAEPYRKMIAINYGMKCEERLSFMMRSMGENLGVQFTQYPHAPMGTLRVRCAQDVRPIVEKMLTPLIPVSTRMEFEDA